MCPRRVRWVRFHGLQRICASLLHEQGTDIRMIMDVRTFVRLDAQRSAFAWRGSVPGDGGDGDGT